MLGVFDECKARLAEDGVCPDQLGEKTDVAEGFDEVTEGCADDE